MQKANRSYSKAMKYKSIITIAICSLLLSSCFLLENGVTMRKFNHKVKTENYKLPNTLEVNLVYNPKINFEITSKAMFLKKIDSAFVKNFKDNLIDKMMNCNIKCTENSSREITISIDHIYFKESLVNREYSKDGETIHTLENQVLLKLEYTVYKNHSDKGKKLENNIYNVTKSVTEYVLSGNNNTFKLGVAEENLMQIAANNCAMYLNDNPKK